MTTWILTTGNSDIQLKNKDNFNNLSLDIYDQLYDCSFNLKKLEDKNLWAVPARALGLAYTPQLDNYYNDLYFPLLDNFYQTLQKQKINVDNIYFIVTDQANIFESERNSAKCPYWKDTITLNSIFEKYLQEKFPNADIKPIVLKPKTNNQGLDHWNSTLNLVRDELSILTKELAEKKVIYVSHQAGTPAISSALQFITLSNFGDKVKFLLGNEYSETTSEIVESSDYLRGIKIQQAKQLILAGLPGAALELLKNIYDQQSDVIKNIQTLVDRFNINYIPEGTDEDEFSSSNAIDRIRTALDLIEIYFKNENYLQGITLLTSAQETFLKAAIVHELANKSFNVLINGNKQKRKGNTLITWTDKGLYFIDQLSDSERKKILDILKFPISSIKKHKQNNYGFINDNNSLFYLLECLNLNFKNLSWKSLKWLCVDKDKHNEYDDDLRNQLMHNLRGVKKDEVVKFILGNSKPAKKMTVVEAYHSYIKKPFIQALCSLELYSNNSTENQLQNQLKDLTNLLN